MKQKTLKEVDWFEIITVKLVDEDINFSFPDEQSQEVTVINSVINERLKQAEEWLIDIMNKESEDSNVTLSNRKNVDLEIAITNIKEAFGNK